MKLRVLALFLLFGCSNSEVSTLARGGSEKPVKLKTEIAVLTKACLAVMENPLRKLPDLRRQGLRAL